jgi:endonuclease YncB( thermonuclease family)
MGVPPAQLQHRRVTPRTTDRYGRMVADVECQQQDAGAWMVRNG